MNWNVGYSAALTKLAANALERRILGGTLSAATRARIPSKFTSYRAADDDTLRAFRQHMRMPASPSPEQAAHNAEKYKRLVPVRLRAVGGQQRDARVWAKNPKSDYWIDKIRGTRGEVGPQSSSFKAEVGRGTPLSDLRAVSVIQSDKAGLPISASSSPAGSLRLYRNQDDALRERLPRLPNSLRAQARKRLASFSPNGQELDDLRTLAHEEGELASNAASSRGRERSVPLGTHNDIGPRLVEEAVAPGTRDHLSWATRGSPAEKELARRYTQFGGTSARPLPLNGRQHRKLQEQMGRYMATAPLPVRGEDLQRAFSTGIFGGHLHPQLESRLIRDFGKFAPDLRGGLEDTLKLPREEREALARHILAKRSRVSSR